MRATRHGFTRPNEQLVLRQLRRVAAHAFSRTAGAPLIRGNRVRLLRDASENYSAWLEAIEQARERIHFECYIIHEDEIGQQFAEVLQKRAADGVKVRLIYDWMGSLWKASRQFWNSLRSAGAEVRCYNPPRIDSPLGWLARDHRKMLTVDGQIGFITGLCVGKMWVGDPANGVEPWRDTGVEIRGLAVSEIEKAFAHMWELCGDPLPEEAVFTRPIPAGNMDVRIVATEPATAGMMRLDQLIAALAKNRLWLTDAYYAGTTSYVQALRAAAKDGVDVRLLVPNGTDIPLLRPLSRAGYRSLLEAGVRIFEWNGSMLHAKSAVADGHWSRVGSTNLNVASWFGNCELDAVIEDDVFASQMEEMYLEDLANSTEVVLDEKRKVRVPALVGRRPALLGRRHGSAGRAAAGAVRLGNTIGAAFTNRRVLGPVEARLAIASGLLMFALAILFFFYPKVLTYPLIFFFTWSGLVLLYRGYRLARKSNG
ncbi:MAG TPA: phospholipase D-like domain-containing protein [Acidobacteriota bacterium]|nr:phospholipase D-like domain-containing protein [Acidobacteriota bacterium]